MNTIGKATAFGASLLALSLWANVAVAGAVCPDAAKLGDGEGSLTPLPNATLTLTTGNAGVYCWDYGLGNVQSAPKEYVDPSTYVPQDVDPYGTLQLPKFFIGGVWVNVTEIGKIDSSNPLGNAYLSGDYTGTSGSININAMSPYGMILTFHTGGVQNLNGNSPGNNPTFYAFWLPAGFHSDSIDWLLQRTDGSKSNGMSNVTLWAVNNDDLTLVPIPAAAWLLGSGLLGLVAVGRRRRAALTSASA